MKKNWLDKVKTWWALWLLGVAVLGFVVTKSANLMAMWQTPRELEETQKSVGELASQLQTYTASNESADAQRDKLIDMLAQKALDEKKGWF